jgi:hypothetical protein
MENIKEYTYIDAMTGRPTGQGYGAAHKGPQIKAQEQDVIVDYDYGVTVEYKD